MDAIDPYRPPHDALAPLVAPGNGPILATRGARLRAAILDGVLHMVDVLGIFAEQRRCLHDLLAGTAVFTSRSVRAVKARGAAQRRSPSA